MRDRNEIFDVEYHIVSHDAPGLTAQQHEGYFLWNGQVRDRNEIFDVEYHIVSHDAPGLTAQRHEHNNAAIMMLQEIDRNLILRVGRAQRVPKPSGNKNIFSPE